MKSSASLDSPGECSTVLWERGRVVCVAVIQPGEPSYEIRLFVDTALVVAATFTDYEAAARHAVEQLHTYSACSAD
jgi:hypothetical protein